MLLNILEAFILSNEIMFQAKQKFDSGLYCLQWCARPVLADKNYKNLKQEKIEQNPKLNTQDLAKFTGLFRQLNKFHPKT